MLQQEIYKPVAVMPFLQRLDKGFLRHVIHAGLARTRPNGKLVQRHRQQRIHFLGGDHHIKIRLHHDFTEEVIGLDRFRPEDRPPVLIPFLSWRMMVGAGTFFILLTIYACFLLRKGTLWEKRWLLWVFVAAVLPALLANEAGWVAAEVGRQPWIVHPPIPRDTEGELIVNAEGIVEYALNKVVN